ncbi:dimethylallyltransferase [Rhodococcoides trifolii]|uniref:Dimethylallyltransferase n=1 Tax=Rhodococcoides trifolii TaxID=908250 RepID=A0A917CQE7_9NOCA|nr:type 1 glutamine amidotransferase domain-containing protein [Rhodococcus trifolii]GGF93801.1 dimethylallyltransferase [Rhodococcus trifolii]
MTNLLFAVTGADHWTLKDGSKHPTGFWAEELVESHRTFTDAGWNVTVATPGGVKPTVDQGSLAVDANGGDQAKVDDQKAYLEKIDSILSSPQKLEDQKASDFDVVFVPGGHGPMEDLAVSKEFGALVVDFLDSDKVVSAVCHAPAALLPATRTDGSWAFSGYDVTGFTNEEETQAGLADKAPWLLETRLRDGGGSFSSGEAWGPHIVVDRTVYTGQNPASTKPLAERLVADLG